MPVLRDYSEDTFGADFMPTEADYTDPEVQEAINAKGWMLWPPIRYTYNTVVKRPADARTVAARLARTCSAPTTRRATCWRG